MTHQILYVDDDLETVLLDINGTDGASGAGFFVMGDPDFGPTVKGLSLLRQQGVDGAMLATSQNDITAMVLTIGVRGETTISVDQVIALWRRLELRVAQGGFIKVQLDGESDPRFYRALPSGIPNLIGGQKDAVLHVSGGARETNPSPVAIILQPDAWLTPLDASVNLSTNASLLIDTDDDGRPDGVTWSGTLDLDAESIDSDHLAYAITRSGVHTESLQWANVAASPGDVHTFSLYVESDIAGVSVVSLVVKYLKSDLTVLATATGTAYTVSPADSFDDRVRLTLTTSAAPATTAFVQRALKFTNASGAAVVTYVSQEQIEEDDEASAFTLGSAQGGNAVATKPILLWNPGNRRGLVRLSINPSAGSIVQLRAALRSYNRPAGKRSNLTEWLNSFAVGFELEDATLESNTASHADANASANSVARSTLTAPPADDQGTLEMCWTLALSPTDATALEGAFNVYAMVTTSDSAKFRLQVRSAGSASLLSVTLPYAAAPVTYDTSAVDSGDLAQYSAVMLGTVRLDTNRGDDAIILQGWASLETSGSSAKLDWDCLRLMPCDELAATYTEPTFVPGGGTTDSWGGFQLITPADPAGLGDGTVRGQIMVLNEDDQAGGTAPDTGFHPDAGRHYVSADVSMLNGNMDKMTIGELVARIVGSPGSDIKTVDLVTKPDRRWTRTSGDQVPTIQFDVPGDADTTDLIEYFVRQTAATHSERQIDIFTIDHHVLQAATGGSGDPIIIDAAKRSAYIEGSNPIFAPQGFVEIPSGYSVLSLIVLDLSNMGFEDVYSGPNGPEAMAAFVADRLWDQEADVTGQVGPL